MRAKVLTLRFSPQLGRFDDSPLIALQQTIILEHLREHLVQIGNETMLLCLATWRERPAAASPPPKPTHEANPDSTPPTPAEPPPPPPADPVGALRAEFTPEQQRLFDQLRSFRRERAHAEGAPPYVILTNRQLVELVRQRPQSRTALHQINGLGDKKIGKFGEGLLAILRNHQHNTPEPITAESASAETAT